MRHRPGITLVEVLAAIFIMGIGLMALLVLFPVGALSMARAVRDDRAAAAGANGASLAIAFDVRNDPLVVAAYPAVTNAAIGSTVYVDPYYSSFTPPRGNQVGDTATNLPRVGVSYFASTNRKTDLTRYFSFQDEIVFNNLGTPNTSNIGAVDRPSTYTWAYLLRRYGTNSGTTINPVESTTELSVVVYAGRKLQPPGGEAVFSGNLGTAGSNTLTLNYTANNVPDIRKGDWVLDVSPNGAGANAYFYRVDSVVNTPSTLVMTLNLETTLKQSVTTLVAMQNVITVIDRGVAWK